MYMDDFTTINMDDLFKSTILTQKSSRISCVQLMHVYGHLVIPEPCYLVRSYCTFEISTKFAALWPYAVDIEASALVCLGRFCREVLSSKPGGVLGH